MSAPWKEFTIVLGYMRAMVSLNQVVSEFMGKPSASKRGFE
jgi:hypothetical protein